MSTAATLLGFLLMMLWFVGWSVIGAIYLGGVWEHWYNPILSCVIALSGIGIFSYVVFS